MTEPIFDPDFEEACVQMLKHTPKTRVAMKPVKTAILRAQKFILMTPWEFEHSTRDIYSELT